MRSAVATFGDGAALHAHLLESKTITSTQLAHAVAAMHDLPYTDLTSRELDPAVVALVPSALCRRYKVIPLERRRRSIVLGMVDPSDIIAMDDIQRVIDVNLLLVSGMGVGMSRSVVARCAGTPNNAPSGSLFSRREQSVWGETSSALHY
ncbi:hypothetical protein FVP60_11395 [Microbacterium mitrae]|uniref:Type II secretion system protein GspE N-terminal domain-containing protein n=2 Tax=Microbacterium mitrae TaxID=664640 RepID=A0A5C8HL24_9MICO|nr:hypothetical protein FVP60_11395 [Microbacterium mitrae]